MTDVSRGGAVTYVTDHLRAAILDGRLRPGERIQQDAVAREVGVSRSPVRDALRQLQSEGLVELSPNRGARVTRLSPIEFDEVYRLRERLDPAALAESTPRLSDEQIERFRGYVAEMDEVEHTDPVRWAHLDRAFHFESRRAAPLPQFLSILENLWNITAHYRRAYIALPRSTEFSRMEHRLLLDALERRDPEDASRILTMHIRRTRLCLAAHPELFEP